MSNVWKWSRDVFPDSLVPEPGTVASATAAYEQLVRVRRAAAKQHQSYALAEEVAELDVATRTAMATYLPVKYLAKIAPVLLSQNFHPSVHRKWATLGPPAAVLARARTERVPVVALRLAVEHVGSSVWAARWSARTGLLTDDLLEDARIRIPPGESMANQSWLRLRAAHAPLTTTHMRSLAGRHTTYSRAVYEATDRLGLARLVLPGFQQGYGKALSGFDNTLRDVAELQLDHLPLAEIPPVSAAFDVADLCAEPHNDAKEYVALSFAVNTVLGCDVEKWAQFVSDVACSGPHNAAVKAGIIA